MGGVFKTFDIVVYLFNNHSANFGKMEAMQRDIVELKVRWLSRATFCELFVSKIRIDI